MTPKELRAKNFLALLEEFGSLAEMHRAAARRKVKLNEQHLSHVKTGKRGIGDDFVRTLEKGLGKPKGWMDQAHDGEHIGPPLTAALVRDFEALPPAFQEHVSDEVAALRAYADSLPEYLRVDLRRPPDPSQWAEWWRQVRADMEARAHPGGGHPQEKALAAAK